MALSAQDRRLAESVFHQGPAVLEEEGWSSERIVAFTTDPDVQRVWMLLKREFDIFPGLLGRTKFKATRNMARLVDLASSVIMQAIAGPDYLRDEETGEILRDQQGRPRLMQSEPTPTQLRSAEFVMEAVGVRDAKVLVDAASDPSLALLFASSEDEKIKVEDDPALTTHEARALSRERVRNAMLKLGPKIVDVRASVKRSMGIDPATETSVAKRDKRRHARIEKARRHVKKKKAG